MDEVVCYGARTMSDTSQGPGWWQASDEKWYPPNVPHRGLAPCSVCEHPMAWSARRCPNCGALSRRVRTRRRNLFIGIVVLVVVVALCFAILNSSLGDAPSKLSYIGP